MHISAKCSIAVHCLIFVHEYGARQKVTSDLLAQSTGSNPVTIRTILSALKKAGILAVRPGTGGTTLLCPPEEITLYQICQAVEPGFTAKCIGIHPMPSQVCPVGRTIHSVLDSSYQKVLDDLCESLRSVTLKQILINYHTALNAP